MEDKKKRTGEIRNNIRNKKNMSRMVFKGKWGIIL